jgi:deoxycytidylate deaminase
VVISPKLLTAIKAAQANPIEGLSKMAAVIYDRNRLISIGLNSHKTHPLAKQFQKNVHALKIHAEIAAIVNARQSVEGMSMFIARVNRSGLPMLAKPCNGCFRAITAFGIKNVHWTENYYDGYHI